MNSNNNPFKSQWPDHEELVKLSQGLDDLVYEANRQDALVREKLCSVEDKLSMLERRMAYVQQRAQASNSLH